MSGDVPLTPMVDVRCCGFWPRGSNRKVFYPLVRRGGFAVCRNCGGSYGSWPTGGLDYSKRRDLVDSRKAAA